MLTKEWIGYTQEDREIVAEIVRKVCYYEELSVVEMEYLNQRPSGMSQQKVGDRWEIVIEDTSISPFQLFIDFLLSLDE